MKISLWIEEGREQVVVTPETETERDILKRVTDGTRVVRMYRGQFYQCQGGWTREGPNTDSTIIVLDRKQEIAANG